MRLIRNVLACSLVLAGVLSLAGCGNKYTDSQYEELESTYSELESAYSELNTKYSDLSAELAAKPDLTIFPELNVVGSFSGTGNETVTPSALCDKAKLTCDGSVSISYTKDGKSYDKSDSYPSGVNFISFSDYGSAEVDSVTVSCDCSWELELYDSEISEYTLSYGNTLEFSPGVYVVKLDHLPSTSILKGIMNKLGVTYEGEGTCMLSTTFDMAGSLDSYASYTYITGDEQLCWYSSGANASGYVALNEYSGDTGSMLDTFLIVRLDSGKVTLTGDKYDFGFLTE